MHRLFLFLLLALGLAISVRGQDALAPDDDSPQAALLKACTAGDTTGVVEAIVGGAVVDGTTGADHTTPLMLSAKAGHLDILLYLLSKGAQIDLTDDAGNTALNLACISDSTEEAEALLKAGANPNLGNKEGRFPLMSAAAHGNNDLVSMLFTKQVDVNMVSDAGSAVWCATFADKVTTVQALIDNGASLNPRFPPPVDPTNPRVSVLGAAATTGDLGLLRLLLNKGANVDGTGPDGTSALGVAAEHNQVNIMQELLRQDANIDLANLAGETPLILAAAHGHVDAIAFLLKNQAKLEIPDQNGMTALIRASARGQDTAAQYLMGHGANINVVDAQGETALTHAGDIGDNSLVKTLADRGAIRTDVHIIARPMPQPPLAPAQTWALSIHALYTQATGDNPHLLGGGVPSGVAIRTLQRAWAIPDQATFVTSVQALIQTGDRTTWQEDGARLSNLNAAHSDLDEEGLRQADALRDSYRQWRERCGLAWDLCRAAHLVNLGYAAGYLNEQEAWTQLLDIARQLQGSFSSWAEVSVNFMDGSALKTKRNDIRANACAQLLLNPQDPNSPWNQNPWKTDLGAPAGP